MYTGDQKSVSGRNHVRDYYTLSNKTLNPSPSYKTFQLGD